MSKEQQDAFILTDNTRLRIRIVECSTVQYSTYKCNVQGPVATQYITCGTR